jgi:hypothetical protein
MPAGYIWLLRAVWNVERVLAGAQHSQDHLNAPGLRCLIATGSPLCRVRHPRNEGCAPLPPRAR